MPLSPVVVEKFGGLRLDTDPGEIGLSGATNALNVEFTEDRTRVSTRPGSLLFAEAGLAPRAIKPAVLGGVDYLLALDYGKLQKFPVSGSPTLATVPYGAGNTFPQILNFGTPGTSYAICLSGSTSIFTYDGSITNPLPGNPGFAAITAQSNRLAVARFVSPDSPTGGGLGSPSTVFFSNAGNPFVFSANDYVHLTPGDGEAIVGMVAWGDLLFVFKQTRAFVFYGESTDGTGNPVFNYRQITLTQPVDLSSGFQRVVSSSRAVYFLAVDGVYRTTGGQPERVSGTLNPIFGQPASPIGHLSAVGGRVYFQIVGGGHYVFDERNGEWSYWEFRGASGATSPLVSWPKLTADSRQVLYGLGSSIYRTSPTATDDAGVALASRYRTGFTDLGTPNMKVMRELVADGTGSVNAGVAVDWKTQPAGTALTLGTSPQVAQARSRVAARGRSMRVQFDATSGAWSLNRFSLNMRSGRPVGVKQS